MDPDEKLQMIVERARKQAHLEVSIGDGSGVEEALDNADNLADDIQELHEWLMKGGFLPAAWRTSTARFEDAIKEARHEQMLLIAWTIHQQGKPELRVRYEDLTALDCTAVRRWDDHDKQEIVFTLVDRPRHLNSVEEN